MITVDVIEEGGVLEYSCSIVSPTFVAYLVS